LANGNVELKARRDGKEGIKVLKPENAVNEILQIYKNLLKS
jgi:hypothetical protein